MKRAFNILICLIYICKVYALQPQIVVEQKMDAVGMLIGEQAHLSLEVTASKKSIVEFPQFEPSQILVPGVEVLSWSDDTMSVDDNTRIFIRKYTLTSFDESLYPIPAIPVKVDEKEYKGKAGALKVISVDVDTLHPGNFFPPKAIQNNPFLVSEWLPMLLQSLLLFVLLVMGYYLYCRIKNHRPIISIVRVIKKIPAHQTALKEIEKLKEERLVSSENNKLYYTRLTDVLRRYIQERYGFNAMDMTTDEIIHHLHKTNDKAKLDEMSDLFQTADLVKFAKYKTLINENDLNLVKAIAFIDETKDLNAPTEEKIVPKLSKDDTTKARHRHVAKILLCIVSTISIILACIIIRGVALLVF